MEIGFYNGEFIPIHKQVIPIQERGHQFGDGVYEVIRVYRGVPFLMDEHLDRLERSAETILLTLPFKREKIEEIILEGLKRCQLEEAEIYLQITRGIAPRNHLFPDTKPMMAMTIKAPRIIPEEKRRTGAAVLLHEDERWANCYIKSLNLLPNILAKQAAHDAGYDEAVFVKEGHVTEGSSSNVFIVKNGTLITPPATKRILHGITRQLVLEIAHNLDIPVREEEITVEQLKEADEVFITSTSLEIMPVAAIGGELQLQVSTDSLTFKLYRAFRDFCQQH